MREKEGEDRGRLKENGEENMKERDVPRILS